MIMCVDWSMWKMVGGVCEIGCELFLLVLWWVVVVLYVCEIFDDEVVLFFELV